MLRSGRAVWGTYPCSAHVLNGGDFVAYSTQTLISIQLDKCSIRSFQRTSQIEFSLRETVDEGEGVVDQVRGQPHVGGMGRVSARLCGRETGSIISLERVELECLALPCLAWPGLLCGVLFGAACTSDMGNSKALPSFALARSPSALPSTHSHSASPAGCQ